MTVWKFEKRAGLILDHQDDPGAGFRTKIASFWPSDLPEPTLGIKEDSNKCVADLSDGHTKIARYPVDNPTNALSSAMYFIAYGKDCIEKKAHVPIAEGIKNALVAYDVSLPDGFVPHIKEAAQRRPDEVYADNGQNLPVTTPGQCSESIGVFEKHASEWSADDRMVIARKLKHAAQRHGLNQDVAYSAESLCKTAERAIDLRIEVMEPLTQHDGRATYLQRMAKLKHRLSNMGDYETLLKTASDLEKADIEASMNTQWGGYFPDPVESLVSPMSSGDPLGEFDKKAEIDWDSVDFSGLEGQFEPETLEKVASDPANIVPSLPTAERNIIIKYAEESTT